MINYLNEKFTAFIKDKELNEQVIGENPVPEANCLKAPKIDSYVEEIFESANKSFGWEADTSLTKVQYRICNIMGPLGRLWLNLEQIRTGESSDELDLFDCLKLIEQSITLIGQTNVSLIYARRMNVLGRLTGDSKKAKKLLHKHEACLNSKKSLFGKEFYKALTKASKIKKSSKEISMHLSGKIQAPSRGSFNTSGHRGRGQQRSFRGGPSSYRRGGGRYMSFKPRQKPQYAKGKCIIRFRKPTAIAHRSAIRKIRINRVLSSHSKLYGTGHINCIQTPPLSRSAPVLPQLEVSHTGPIHFTNSSRGVDPLLSNPPSEFTASPMFSQPDREIGHRGRNFGNVAERGNSGGLNTKGGVCKHYISCEEKGRGEQAGNKSEAVKQFCSIPAFQNGRFAFTETYNSEGGLDGKNRSERCLLYSSHRSKTPKFSQVYLRPQEVPVYVSPFWLRSCSFDIHKTVETSGSSVTETMSQNNHLPGRYNPVQPYSGRGSGRQGYHSLVASEFRFCNQLEKISTYPFSIPGIPGFCDQVPGNESDFTRWESRATSSDMQRFDKGRECLGENPVSCNCAPSSSPLSTFTTITGRGSVERAGLRGHCSLERGLSEGPSTVDRSIDHVEWPLDNNPCSRYDYYNRCLLEGVGGVCQGKHTRGMWTLEESKSLHINALELKAALFSLRAFTLNQRKIHVHMRMDNRTAVAYLLKMGGTRSASMLQIAQELWDYALSNQITLTAEYLPGKVNQEADWESRNCRDFSNWRLNPLVFQSLNKIWGPLEIDLFADSMNTQLPKYMSWFPDPFAQGTDAFQILWKDLKGYCFPPFAMICRPQRSCNNGSDNSSLECSSLVSSSLGNVMQSTNPASSIEQHTIVTQSATTPISSAGPSPVSGLEGYRQTLLTSGVSEQTAELLRSHSWRKGTTGAYNSAWKQWSCWCGKRKIDPFCSPVETVADYLADLLREGRSYRTINSHRSAISAFHPPVNGIPLGQHELICKVVAACFNANPPHPKYKTTWDVDLVLQHLRSLGCNTSLSDKNLTLKVSMLIALASAGRSSDLRALDTRYMLVSDDSLSFELAQLTKSRARGKGPLKQSFDRFPGDPILCVYSAILAYLERTKEWRSGPSKHQLLLSYVKPHKEVVQCTITGWLVQVMQQSGVDTANFRAHSTRGASSSKAKAQGLSCKEILEMARWKKESTFKRHYLRDIPIVNHDKNTFQKIVLGV